MSFLTTSIHLAATMKFLSFSRITVNSDLSLFRKQRKRAVLTIDRSFVKTARHSLRWPWRRESFLTWVFSVMRIVRLDMKVDINLPFSKAFSLLSNYHKVEITTISNTRLVQRRWNPMRYGGLEVSWNSFIPDALQWSR